MATRKDARKPVSTTPTYDRSANRSLRAGLLKLATLVVVPLLLLGVYGQPALRIEYTWHGSEHAPIYTRCIYLAFDGWHEIRPTYGINQCPLVDTLPVDLGKFLFG